MAMTKKEREDRLALMGQIELLKAFRWTEPVEPDVLPPSDGFAEGWTFNHHARRAQATWSNAFNHGFGPAPTTSKFLATQGPMPLFSTAELALRAMRHKLVRSYAETLLDLDRQIEAARTTIEKDSK